MKIKTVSFEEAASILEQLSETATYERSDFNSIDLYFFESLSKIVGINISNSNKSFVIVPD